MERVCAVRVIAESDTIQAFLTDTSEESNNIPIELKILLPDKEVICVTVRKNSNSDKVFAAVIDKIQLNEDVAKFFYLFEILEYNFGKFTSHRTGDLITIYLLFSKL